MNEWFETFFGIIAVIIILFSFIGAVLYISATFGVGWGLLLMLVGFAALISTLERYS